jgi:hypothetical protein
MLLGLLFKLAKKHLQAAWMAAPLPISSAISFSIALLFIPYTWRGQQGQGASWASSGDV